MLELAILGLLQEKAMHGYELKKQLTQKLGHFWPVSYGSLYPALKRLEQRGSIEPVFSEDDTRRSKNVYRITEAGRREFLELIEDKASTTWEEEKFPLRFAFFRHVKPEIRLRLLERRKADLQDKLGDLRRSMREEQDRIDGYTLSLLRHGMDATASDIAWLDELIAAEKRQLAADTDKRQPVGADADDHSAASPSAEHEEPEEERPADGRVPRREPPVTTPDQPLASPAAPAQARKR